MKKLISFLIAVVLVIQFAPTLFATGDGNMDGGGGDMGEGTNVNIWHVGDDGVRVTVINDKTNTPATAPVDFANKTQTVRFHGGKNSKISYANGKALSLQGKNTYKAEQVASPMPQIISANGGSNISAVKAYFCDKATLQHIASKVGIEYETLISGKYKLLIEPIAYFTYRGMVFAFTATEAALYNQRTSGDLRAQMGNLTSKNLPLSMFLEVSDLGFPAWGGTTSGFVSDHEIVTSLGLGVVKFADAEPDVPPVEGNTLEYRTNTDVYTSVWLYNYATTDISPDDEAEVTINIDGKRYTQPFVIPAQESTLVWVKWHTPAVDSNVPITISATNGAVVEYSSVTAVVRTLEEKTPPDPKGTDLNDGFSIPSLPTGDSVLKRNWSEWNPYWVPDWQWVPDWVWVDTGHKDSCLPGCTERHGTWDDLGQWEDLGEWHYAVDHYTAELLLQVSIAPASSCPTAYRAGYRWVIKSGYGINVEAQCYTYGTDVTGVQNVITLFPEFQYTTYNRLLEEDRYNHFVFKNNPFSYAGINAHYTPIWFPRNKNEYTPFVWAFDSWCPAGQLYANGSDTLLIEGDCYDDWNIRPVRE